MSEPFPFRVERSQLLETMSELCDLVVYQLVVDASAGQDRATTCGLDGTLVTVVADGAGGTSGGTEAAGAVVDAVQVAIKDGRLDDWAAVLREVDQQLAGAGQTTAVVVQVRGENISGASVGDSSAMLYSASSSHELTEHQQRKPLVGSGNANPVSFAARFTSGSVLLLGTDGLFNYTGRKKIRDLALGVGLPADFVDLVRLPSGGLQDDVAVIVCRELLSRETT